MFNFGVMVDILKYKYRFYKTKKKIKRKLQCNCKINVGFFFERDCTPATEPLLLKMLDYNEFNPMIFVVLVNDGCDVGDPLLELQKTYNYFKNKYPNIAVINTYDNIQKKHLDVSDMIDIMVTIEPYNRVNKLYSTSYLHKKNVLPVYIPYGATITSDYSVNSVYSTNEVIKCWKVYAEKQNVVDKVKNTPYKAYNLNVSGSCRMASIHKLVKNHNNKKSIILSPHQMIGDRHPGLPFSSFLKYSDFFLDLPKRYPDINFIFRPHPSLKDALSSINYWGMEKTQRWFDIMQSYPNVEYQDGGDYLQSFVDSDGMIQECSSFLTEYLYTDNPGCYLLKNDEITNLIFNDFGKQCLEHWYTAYNEQDIIDYIENVVLGGNDYKKDARKEFADKELKINYPNVAKFILDDILSSLK